MLPPHLAKLSVAAMTALHLALPLGEWAAPPGSLFGLVPLGLGLLLHRWAQRRFRRLGAPAEPRAEPAVLVTQGPFRFSRHPMYLGMVLGLFGYAVLLGSVSPLLVLPAFVLWVERRFVRPEERALEQSFGEDYASYCDRTARWI